MKYVVCLILVVGLTATANADAWTWFSYESDPVAAAADKGQVLLIGPVLETVTIHQWVEVDEPMELGLVSCDLAYDGHGGISIDSVTTDVGISAFGYWAGQDAPTIDSDGAWAYGGFYFAWGAPFNEAYITAADGVQHVASVELTMTYDAMTLFGGIGINTWAQAGGLPFDVHYGGSVINSQDTTTLVPVLMRPEPATLALLGFGAAVLIRRR